MKYLSVAAFVLLCVACSHNHNGTTVNSTDSYFMQQASYSNNAEIGAGGIAATQGSYDSVKIFGSMMVSDHGKAESSLDSLANELSISIPSTPDSVHQAKAAYLQTLSGHTFDTVYINAQVQDHIATIAIFQQELSGGNNQQIKNYAQEYLPVIEMHLQEAQSIQQTIE